MFFKNIWNNFWTQSDEIKYFSANADDQHRNQNNGENSSNTNNSVVDFQKNNNSSAAHFQNQTKNIEQDFNMFEAEELWYYWLLNTNVLFHQWFNQQKQFFFINNIFIINNHLLTRNKINFLFFYITIFLFFLSFCIVISAKISFFFCILIYSDELSMIFFV